MTIRGVSKDKFSHDLSDDSSAVFQVMITGVSKDRFSRECCSNIWTVERKTHARSPDNIATWIPLYDPYSHVAPVLSPQRTHLMFMKMLAKSQKLLTHTILVSNHSYLFTL